MKAIRPVFLSLLPLCSIAQDTPVPVSEKLTEQQVNNVLSQLKDLEADILNKRGSNLSSVLAKLNAAIASDQSALKFYTDCDVLVNVERKEEGKSEARDRAEQMQKALDRKSKGGGGPAADDGDSALAIRLGIRYLILTLEAHEAKEEDFKKMVPKLQSYINDLVSSAPKLRGRALGMLNRSCADGSPIVEAYQLSRFLNRDGWSTNPSNIGGMYGATIFKIAESEAKESLPDLWTARINAEGAFRKEHMTEPEFILWGQNELPALRWQRATYLYKKGPSLINAMGDMLKLIKDYPTHPDAPSWVNELRTFVNESSPTPVSSAAGQ